MLINVPGIPAIIALIWVGNIYFAIFMTVVMLIAITEFYTLAKIKELTPVQWIGWLMTLLIGYIYYFQPAMQYKQIILVIIAFVTCALLIELFRNRPAPTLNIAITLMGVLYVPVLLGALIGIRNWDTVNHSNMTFGIIIAIWICDTAAYFVGKKWGRKKIFKRVSPNKTVAGTIGGYVGALLTFIVMKEAGFLGSDFRWIDVLAFSIITGIFGQLGDFVESLMKRDAGVKDSGTILLGHGGVLDRFDSLILASPIAYIYLITLS